MTSLKYGHQWNVLFVIILNLENDVDDPDVVLPQIIRHAIVELTHKRQQIHRPSWKINDFHSNQDTEQLSCSWVVKFPFQEEMTATDRVVCSIYVNSFMSELLATQKMRRDIYSLSTLRFRSKADIALHWIRYTHRSRLIGKTEQKRHSIWLHRV